MIHSENITSYPSLTFITTPPFYWFLLILLLFFILLLDLFFRLRHELSSQHPGQVGIKTTVHTFCRCPVSFFSTLKK